jgi:hypothetical protein
LKAFSPGTVDLRVSSANSESCSDTSLTYCVKHSMISKYLCSIFVSETETHTIKKKVDHATLWALNYLDSIHLTMNYICHNLQRNYKAVLERSFSLGIFLILLQ